MRQRKIIRTTLGELIVAVTDEVMPIIRDPAGAYVVVSWVLNDVLTYQRLHERRTWFLSEIVRDLQEVRDI